MKANKKPNTVSKTKSNALVTPREVEIIGWIKTGKTNQEIGNILHISQNTVKTHLKRLFQKLKVSRRAQLAAMLRFK
jgi:DNA-binding CsgD family transcriptional regulator